MKIILNNVARVQHAEVEIKGISVISGYNGTGKSTVCKALYATSQAFGRLNKRVLQSRENSIKNSIDEWESKSRTDSDPFWEECSDNFFNLLEQMKLSLEDLTDEDLPKLLQRAGIDPEEDGYEDLLSELGRIRKRPFEDDAHFVIERAFSQCFSGQLNTLGQDTQAEIQFEYGKSVSRAAFQNNKLTESTATQILMNKPVYIETGSSLDMVINNQYRRRLSASNGKIPFSALYKSATGVMTLEKYNELNKVREICSRIMNEVTHGELVSSTTNREITYHEEDLQDPILCPNIASGLKNILTIQKLLDNGYLNSNSLLLIDEPEVNLHPEWQVKFAEILVLLYKELGIRIILNTHSPYFMRAIETKLAEQELADMGRYYFMKEVSPRRFVAEDVTGKTEIVYRTMYKPLEGL